MKAREPRPSIRPLRVVGIVLGASLLLAVTLVALVCYKTGLQPGDFAWFEGWRPSNLVAAILREARVEVAVLGVAALNLALLLVRLHAVDTAQASGSHRDDASSDVAAPGAGDPGESSAHAGVSGRESDEPLATDVPAVIGRVADAADIEHGSPPERVAEPPRAAGASAAARAAANADAQLEIAAGELTRLRRELSDCRSRLDAANATRSRFLANMSHELRTPMNGIIGMTDLLLGGELPPRERRFAQSIASSSNALLGVISDLLDFSGIESGTLTLERSRFRIRDAVEDVCAMLAERAHAKGIELMCYVDDNVPALADGDASRLRQVLDNVIRNAIAFTDEGEVVVRVSREEERGARSLYRCDVQDTGRGISPEMQMTMFDAFTQEDGSSTRRHGGLGLGLAIVRELVAMMGGTITFRSRLGEGTRFGFTVELDNAEDDDGALPGARSIRGARVLVVDDNETNRTILYHQLSGWGVVADTVESGEEALERLHETLDGRGRPYDLLVLDLHMPGMDGIELARRIRTEPRLGAMRSLMLTSAALDLDDGELAALGIDRYVSKPPRQSVLHESLVSLLPSGASAGAFASFRDAASVRADGVRVLLAEDNVESQDVGVGLLESAGCHVDVAVDGRGALERADAGHYDLILMDCRMPGIDGYAATRSIRVGDGPNAGTPIVALTASAMKGDRERCLAAGMDDHVAKPIRRDDLNALLARWIVPGAAVTAGAGVPARDAEKGLPGDATEDSTEDAPKAVVNGPSDRAAESAAGDAAEADGEALPPSVDDVALEAIRALQRPGKPDLLAKVLKTFFARTPAILDAMHRALEAGDAAALGEQMHSLKASAAYVGAARLSALCTRLERASADGDASAVAALVARIDGEFADVSATLAERGRAA